MQPHAGHASVVHELDALASNAALMAANPLTIAVPDISAPVSIRSTV